MRDGHAGQLSSEAVESNLACENRMCKSDGFPANDGSCPLNKFFSAYRILNLELVAKLGNVPVIPTLKSFPPIC